MYIASNQDIEKFASEVKKLLEDRVEEVILYGSYARDEHTPGSDIDVLILVSEKKKRDREKIAKLSGRYFNEKQLKFSPLILETKEFRRKLEQDYSFHRNVREEGVEI